MTTKRLTATDKDYLKQWKELVANFSRATPVDFSESPSQQAARIRRLEANPEEWFRYYFPNYCSAEPAPFHKAATKRLLSHDEWFEVRAWARELAKSARSMMELFYLALTHRIHATLVVSATLDAAVELILPWRAALEGNNRIINDYGDQRGSVWKEDKLVTTSGWFVRAIGWGQSPRGTRNENFRPDSYIIDDIDTDEECRNEDIQQRKINWIEQALLGTRSISTKTRILVNGNIIHDNCCVSMLARRADKFDIVNIRDVDGKSTWPAKNTEEDIDRTLSLLSYESAQKEYFNNPMDGTELFRDLSFAAVPRITSFDEVLVYADPATSNRDTSSGSMKAVGVIARKGLDFYVLRCRVDNMSTSRFVDALFELHLYAARAGDTVNVYIENNSLQNPFYEQVLYPLICTRSSERGVILPVIGDNRDKKDKYARIEGTLEPLVRNKRLHLNAAEERDPDMLRLLAQFRNFSRKQRRMDAPDMVEGGVFILQSHAVSNSSEPLFFPRRNSRKW